MRRLRSGDDATEAFIYAKQISGQQFRIMVENESNWL